MVDEDVQALKNKCHIKCTTMLKDVRTKLDKIQPIRDAIITEIRLKESLIDEKVQVAEKFRGRKNERINSWKEEQAQIDSEVEKINGKLTKEEELLEESTKNIKNYKERLETVQED